MVLVALTAGSVARAADMSPSGIKAPVASSPAWTGFYLGAHFGYAGGRSDWAATGASFGKQEEPGAEVVSLEGAFRNPRYSSPEMVQYSNKGATPRRSSPASPTSGGTWSSSR
jgi:hypothetical protein